MKKLLIGLVSLSVLLVGFVPAQAAGEYVARQKTLSVFSGSTTTLTSTQRAEVKQAVDANPYAEKFICTGIRLEGQPMSLNVVVRKRAKAACDYAKQTQLITWDRLSLERLLSRNPTLSILLKHSISVDLTKKIKDQP